jgi:hypothetical protein
MFPNLKRFGLVSILRGLITLPVYYSERKDKQVHVKRQRLLDAVERTARLRNELSSESSAAPLTKEESARLGHHIEETLHVVLDEIERDYDHDGGGDRLEKVLGVEMVHPQWAWHNHPLN